MPFSYQQQSIPESAIAVQKLQWTALLVQSQPEQYSVSFKTPEIVSEHRVFFFDNIHDSKTIEEKCISLAQEAVDLLNYMEKCDLKCKNYALELYPLDPLDSNKSLWSLRIRFEVAAWFRYWKRIYANNEFQLSQLVSNAKDYLSQIQTQIAQESSIEPKTDLASVPKYCTYQVECTNQQIGNQCTKGVHARLVCKHLCQAGHKAFVCGQFVMDELHMPDLDPSDNFVIFARSEPLSEVLLMPKPGYVEHYCNREMAMMDTFWIAVYNFVRKFQAKTNTLIFPIDTYVSLHFGEWESMTAANPKLRDCHAHAHLALSKEALHLLRPILNDSYQSAHLSYWEKDVIALEPLVFNTEMNGFRIEMNDFKTEMNGFKTEMIEFKREMIEFRNEIVSMREEMQKTRNLKRKERNETPND